MPFTYLLLSKINKNWIAIKCCRAVSISFGPSWSHFPIAWKGGQDHYNNKKLKKKKKNLLTFLFEGKTSSSLGSPDVGDIPQHQGKEVTLQAKGQPMSSGRAQAHSLQLGQLCALDPTRVKPSSALLHSVNGCSSISIIISAMSFDKAVNL